MTNKEIIQKLHELKEFTNEIDVSLDDITEKIDDIIYDARDSNRADEIDDPFAVDDELDEFLSTFKSSDF
jgi:hypothetical protein